MPKKNKAQELSLKFTGSECHTDIMVGNRLYRIIENDEDVLACKGSSVDIPSYKDIEIIEKLLNEIDKNNFPICFDVLKIDKPVYCKPLKKNLTIARVYPANF